MIVLLGQMMWGDGDHMGGGWWWVMGIGWLVFLTLIVVLAFVLIRSLTQPRPNARNAADEILAERFARGEIDEQEYRQRRATLRS
jgi:putative membrane protein